MTKKNAFKTSTPALALQPHVSSELSGLPSTSSSSTSSPTPPLLSSWLADLKASLSSIQPDRILKLDLGSPSSLLPTSPTPPSASPPLTPPSSRYTLIIIDHSPPPSLPPPSSPPPPRCGVLILQQGRELESLFSQPFGQLSLCRQHAFHRLVLVALNRGHRFPSLEAVQADLRPHIPPLLPALTPPASVPFLALSSDLGARHSLASVTSPCNGPVLVEDLRLDGHWTRRLLFSRTGCVQSEARLRGAGAQGGETGQGVEYGWLVCQYQQAFVAALALLPHPPQRVLLVGLGAGSLAMFLSRCYPLACIDVVELDPEVVGYARQYFGFEETERMRLTVGDGLQYMAEVQAGGGYDVVCVDCNSPDVEEGLSFPPPTFLTRQQLRVMRDATSRPGLWLLNFGCRREDRRREVLAEVVGVWGEEDGGKVYELDADEEDVNTVLAGRRVGDEGVDVTRAQCRRRVLTAGRVEEQRRQAKEAGVVTGELQWHGDMQLRSRVDSIHVITKERDQQDLGQWRFIRSPLPYGANGEEEGEEEDEEGGEAAGDGAAVMSAEEKKRARARAKRARQKLKKR